MSVSAKGTNSSRGRYLLLGSLALNLLFAGGAGAVALQHSHAAAPLQPVAGIKHGVEYKFNRIVATLPPADARIMRKQFRAEAIKLAEAEAQVRISEEAIRDSLRAQPFDPAAVRNAMAETSAARDSFYQLVHNVVAAATEQMSPAGRETLADWPQRRDRTVITQ